MTATTPSWTLVKPDPSEYASYYHTYVGKVPEGNVLDLLESELADTLRLIGSVDDGRGSYQYAPGKWSIKEVIGHVVDTERIFAYRALTFARGDQNPLPGFEQDDYVRVTDFDRRVLSEMMEEFKYVRRSNILLFRSFTDEEMARTGQASGVTFSARSIPYIIAGHEIHHKKVLRERYLS